MVRILLLMMTLVFAFSASAEAGWLGDKLKEASENIGDRLIDDASDSAYEGSKDSVSPENDTESETQGQYGSGEAAVYEEEAEESAEYSDMPGREEMGQPSWPGSDYGQKPKKKKKPKKPKKKSPNTPACFRSAGLTCVLWFLNSLI